MAAILLAAAPAIAFAQARLTAEGTELVLTTADGRNLRSGDLDAALRDAAALMFNRSDPAR